MIFRNDGTIDLQGRGLLTVYDEVTEAVVDGYIPNFRPIGFSINSKDNIVRSNNWTNHYLTAESELQVMTNLKDVVLRYVQPGSKEEDMVMLTKAFQLYGENLKPGISYTANSMLLRKNDNEPPTHVLNGDKVIITPREPLSLELLIYEGTGNYTMEQINKLMDEKIIKSIETQYHKYVPVPTNFSLDKFVRILPPIHGVIRYTLHDGMTVDHLNIMWNKRMYLRG